MGVVEVTGGVDVAWLEPVPHSSWNRWRMSVAEARELAATLLALADGLEPVQVGADGQG